MSLAHQNQLPFFYYEGFSALGMALTKPNCAKRYRHQALRDKVDPEIIPPAGIFTLVVLAINT